MTENRKVRLDSLKLFIDALIEDEDGYNKVTGNGKFRAACVERKSK